MTNAQWHNSGHRPGDIERPQSLGIFVGAGRAVDNRAIVVIWRSKPNMPDIHRYMASSRLAMAAITRVAGVSAVMKRALVKKHCVTTRLLRLRK